MYSIDFNHEHHLLTITWHRIFTPDEVIAYARDVTARFLRERFRPGYRLIIDMSACGAQPRDTLVAFAQAWRLFPKASRIAIVAVDAVCRAQVRRVMTQPYLRLFDDPGAARAWSIAPEEAVA